MALPRPGTRALRDYIGSRDHWVCGICQQPVDPALSVYESAWAAVVDHIISRVNGGSSQEHNLRIAHYECNRLKKAVPDGTPARQVSCKGCGSTLITYAVKAGSRRCECGRNVYIPALKQL